MASDEEEIWGLWWVVVDTLKIPFEEFAAMSKDTRRKLIQYVVRHEAERLARL
jgi:hypothetical protein